MDGASAWQRLVHITLPSLKGLFILLLILRLGSSLSVGFEQIILQQGPVGIQASEVIDTWVYNNGIIGGNWGISAAAGLVKGADRRPLGDRGQQAGPRLRRARSVREMTTLENSTIGDDTVVERRRERKRPPWMEKPHPVTQVVKSIALAICVALVIIPFWSVIATSIADQETINASGGGMVMWPTGVTFSAYEAVLSGGVVTRAVIISIGITVIGTLLSLAATAGLAYWLSRPNALGAKPVLMLLLGAVLFSPGLIPTYLVVKQFNLIDSLWSLVLPVLVNAFNVIVMRAFFQELPQELFESAAIDGAGSATILFKIVLPLSKAVLAVIGLFYAVAYWNAFFNALLFIQSSDKWPMALVLRTYVVNQTTIGGDQVSAEVLPPQLSLQMAILVIAIVPILVLYPFLQRHFAKGVMIGAVKG